MNDADLIILTNRIAEYRQLRAELDSIQKVRLMLLTPFGAHKDDAFTGNARESRRITDVRFYFSRTQGGEDAVDLVVNGLNVPAAPVGNLLEDLLSKRAAAIIKRMAEL